jgi:hypothetical protein
MVIGRVPARFRQMMIPTVLEKFMFVLSQAALYMQGRARMGELAVAGPDLILGILFIVSFFKLADDGRRSDGHSCFHPLHSRR